MKVKSMDKRSAVSFVAFETSTEFPLNVYFDSAVMFYRVLLLKSFLEILITVSADMVVVVIPIAEIFVILNFWSVPNESTNNKSTTDWNPFQRK